MKPRYLIATLALLLCCGLLSAQTPLRNLSGEGQADTEEAARQFALQDLGSQIEVQVQSITNTTETYAEDKNSSKYKATYNALVKTSVDLPLLGVSFTSEKLGGKYVVKASLEGRKVLPLYKEKLLAAVDSVDTQTRKLPSWRGKATEEEQLLAIISLIDQLEKYRAVMAGLGQDYTTIPQSPVKADELKSRLVEINGTIDTLDKAARKLAKGIDQKNIYIYPATAPGSTEITPFAGALRSALQGVVASMDEPKNAGLIMRGSYEILKDGIDVMYRLMKPDGTVIKSTSARLLPAAWDGYDPKPSTLGIDQLIKQGVAVSSDFRMEVTTNRGKRDLLFNKGEEIEILVKLNRPGYFYAVEHVKNNESQDSLLLEMEPAANGNRKFVFFVNADDTNKWISIGKFRITPPFGIERLQFIASAQDLADRLPGYWYDQENGNWVVGTKADSGKTENAIAEVRTRGLKNTRTQTTGGGTSGGNAPETTESFLTFTTMAGE